MPDAEESMNLDERQNVQASVNLKEERGARPQPSPPISKVGPIVTLIVALLLVGGVVFWGIAKRTRASITVARETQEMAVPAVSVIRPRRASAPQEIVLPANIQSWTDAPVYARTNGYLQRWYADIGAHVRAGQLLAEIDTPEIDQQLEQARADLNTAEANYHLAEITAARYQDLLKTDSVSQQDTDNAVADYHAKKAMVQSAQSNVKRLQDLQSFQKICAPFDGVITARKTDIGALINAGSGGLAQELFHIAATHTMRVYVNVPEVYSRAAKPGLKADLTLTEFPGRRFTGEFVRTARAIDLASRTLLAEIDVSNPAGELLPGAYAEVHFKVLAGSSAYQLPVNTLIFRSDGLQVATVVVGNRVALVPVVVGRDFGTSVEVVAGLKGDETVIVNPPDSLVSDTEVQIVRSADTGGEAP
jgi:RND family efflux transporter MFP subunit